METDTCLFFDAAGKRATFGCFKLAEDHEAREAVSNRLCSTIGWAIGWPGGLRLRVRRLLRRRQLLGLQLVLDHRLAQGLLRLQGRHRVRRRHRRVRPRRARDRRRRPVLQERPGRGGASHGSEAPLLAKIPAQFASGHGP